AAPRPGPPVESFEQDLQSEGEFLVGEPLVRRDGERRTEIREAARRDATLEPATAGAEAYRRSRDLRLGDSDDVPNEHAETAHRPPRIEAGVASGREKRLDRAQPLGAGMPAGEEQPSETGMPPGSLSQSSRDGSHPRPPIEPLRWHRDPGPQEVGD